MKQWTTRDAMAHAGVAKLYRVTTDLGYIWRLRSKNPGRKRRNDILNQTGSARC